jgi:hypothetical protein
MRSRFRETRFSYRPIIYSALRAAFAAAAPLLPVQDIRAAAAPRRLSCLLLIFCRYNRLDVDAVRMATGENAVLSWVVDGVAAGRGCDVKNCS